MPVTSAVLSRAPPQASVALISLPVGGTHLFCSSQCCNIQSVSNRKVLPLLLPGCVIGQDVCLSRTQYFHLENGGHFTIYPITLGEMKCENVQKAEQGAWQMVSADVGSCYYY